MAKAAEAFRTISEVADDLGIQKHVLRFWEAKFNQIRPMKRGGGRRYYRPEDMELLRGIRQLLYRDGYTIKGVQKILREQGVDAVKVHSSKDGGTASNQRSASAAKSSGTSQAKGAKRGVGAKRTAAKKRATQAGDRNEILATIIQELVMCRDLLQNGVAGKTASKGGASRSRRNA
ncbi:MAG: MerR family transcriptional regulator [Hyphomicrobiaceae bacterium]